MCFVSIIPDVAKNISIKDSQLYGFVSSMTTRLDSVTITDTVTDNIVDSKFQVHLCENILKTIIIWLIEMLIIFLCYITIGVLQTAENAKLEEKIKWADAFILMYSVTDQSSLSALLGR